MWPSGAEGDLAPVLSSEMHDGVQGPWVTLGTLSRAGHSWKGREPGGHTALCSDEWARERPGDCGQDEGAGRPVLSG